MKISIDPQAEAILLDVFSVTDLAPIVQKVIDQWVKNNVGERYLAQKPLADMLTEMNQEVALKVTLD